MDDRLWRSPHGNGTRPQLAAALLGDIVSSRQHASGSALFNELLPHLRWVNSLVDALQPLQFTVGDELQGLYRSVGDAIAVSLLLRLRAHPIDVRFGIGLGPVEQTEVADRPFGQTGEGWWRAREALERVDHLQSRRRLATLRTAVRIEDRELESMLSAYLILQDEIVAGMDGRTRAILIGLLQGRQQRQIAEEIGLAPSSVSKRISTSGARAIAAAYTALRAAASA